MLGWFYHSPFPLFLLVSKIFPSFLFFPSILYKVASKVERERSLATLYETPPLSLALKQKKKKHISIKSYYLSAFLKDQARLHSTLEHIPSEKQPMRYIDLQPPPPPPPSLTAPSFFSQRARRYLTPAKQQSEYTTTTTTTTHPRSALVLFFCRFPAREPSFFFLLTTNLRRDTLSY